MRHNFHILLALSALCWMTMNGQAQQWDWAQKLQPGNDGSEVEVLAITELDDDYYMTGRFKGTMQYTDYFNFTCSHTSTGSDFDFFVARATSGGVVKWVTVGGNPSGQDQGNDIAIVQPNRIVVTGYVSKDAGTVTVKHRIPNLMGCAASSNTQFSVSGSGDPEAFVACLNPTTGGLYWINSLRPNNDPNAVYPSNISEGRGIVADPSGGGRFFVTGFFQGDILFRQYTTGGSSVLSTPPSPNCPGIVDFAASAVPAGVVNTFVMQYHIDGNFNWFNQLEGDALTWDDWNMGLDVAAFSGGSSSTVYVTGNFRGDLNQLTSPGGSISNLLSTSDYHAGYILRLNYSNGSYGFFSGGSSCPTDSSDYPINGFISSAGGSFNAQKIETRDPDFGVVTMKSIAVKPNVQGTADPVVVGEWMNFNSVTAPSVYATKTQVGASATSLSSSADKMDAFVARYSNDLLTNSWFNAIGGPEDVNVGGQTEGNYGWYGGDGACGVAYGSSGNVYLTGSFAGSVQANSTFLGPKFLSSSSGSNKDIDAYVAAYDASGDNLFFERLKGPCNSTEKEYGSAVTAESNGYTGAYFAGYASSDVGINELQPPFETELIPTGAAPSISYYGSHAPDECLSAAIMPVPVMPTMMNEFFVNNMGPTADVHFMLPPGNYVVAYRDASITEPMTCSDALPVAWNTVIFTVPGTMSPLNVGPLSGAVYDWYIVSTCAAGRFGVVDPTLFMSAKAGDLADGAVEDGEFSIYPNPVNDVARVTLPAELEGQIRMEITGATGETAAVQTLDATSGNGEISLVGLPSGIYIVRLFDSQGQVLHSERLIKLHE